VHISTRAARVTGLRPLGMPLNDPLRLPVGQIANWFGSDHPGTEGYTRDSACTWHVDAARQDAETSIDDDSSIGRC